MVTLRFDQNRPGPLVPGDRRQLGGAEVVRSCPRGLGRGGGWPPTSPSRGAVLLSFRSADPGSGVSGVHRPRRGDVRVWGLREPRARVEAFLRSPGESRGLCTRGLGGVPCLGPGSHGGIGDVPERAGQDAYGFSFLGCVCCVWIALAQLTGNPSGFRLKGPTWGWGPCNRAG